MRARCCCAAGAPLEGIDVMRGPPADGTARPRPVLGAGAARAGARHHRCARRRRPRPGRAPHPRRRHSAARRRPAVSTRIGLAPGEGDEHPWRWYVPGDPNVSRPRPGLARRMSVRPCRQATRVACPDDRESVDQLDPRRRARRRHHRGRARASGCESGPPAAGEARHRPDRVRHPPRLRGRAAQAAPVPGPRPHRRAHHRRLHRPGRRPVGPLGDPARASPRRRSTRHAETYVEQVGRILDSPEPLEVRRNSEWLGDHGHRGRAAPQRRARPSPACSSATTSPSATPAASPISLMEFLYPLLQGWDSVMVEADVELGGTDQLFNILMGRHAPGAGGPGAPGRAHDAAARRASTASRRCRSRSATTSASPRRRPSSSASSCRSPTSCMPAYFPLTTGWHPDRVDEVVGD